MYWLFDNYWIHPVRTYISTKWLVQEDGAKFAQTINTWSHLMPERFLKKLIQVYLKPRLKRELSDLWDPKDPTSLSPDLWLLPWLPLLGEFSSLLIVLKLKLTQAMGEWEPVLAKALLLPWKGVFDP